jgi:hypothetical protein
MGEKRVNAKVKLLDRMRQDQMILVGFETANCIESYGNDCFSEAKSITIYQKARANRPELTIERFCGHFWLQTTNENKVKKHFRSQLTKKVEKAREREI